MTAPAPTINDFFDQFSRLVALKTQQDQLKLQTRVQQTNILQLGQQVLSQLPKEARDPFIKIFSQQNGLDPQLLTEVASNLPESLDVQRTKKSAEGATSVPAPFVAARELAGSTPQGILQGQVLADLTRQIQAQSPQLTPAQISQFVSQSIAGMSSGRAALDSALAGLSQPELSQGAGVQIGTQLSAGQEQQGQQFQQSQAQQNRQFFAQLGQNESQFGRQLQQSASQFNEELAQRERLAASAHSIDMLRVAALGQKEQGGLTTSQTQEALNLIARLTEDLQKGNLTESAQFLYLSQIAEAYKVLGKSDKDIAEFVKANVPPGVWQKFGKFLNINLTPQAVNAAPHMGTRP